jgi:hypothetical protein
VSNEGKNENVNQGQINYDLDLDAPKEQKPVARPKTVELTIVKRAREQATKQQKDVQETLNERLRTSGAFAAVVKANSVQGSLAKALGFQSNINQVIKSVGVAFQATQPAIRLAQQMTEAHKSIARSMEPMLETMRQLGEKIQKMFEALRQSLPSFSSIFKKISSAITNRITPFVQTVVSKFVNFKPPPITNFLKQCIEQVHRLGQSLYKKFDFGKIFQPLADFFKLLLKSNFYLVVRASEGDSIASHKLAKMWWKLGREYYRLERLQGREPTEDEFRHIIQTTCLEILKENEHKSMGWGLKAAQTVFYSLVHCLIAQYIRINDDKVASEWVEFNVYVDEKSNKEYLFLGTIARQVGISDQTLRNWIESGELEAIKTSFYSKLRSSKAVAFLVPYREGLVAELTRVKAEKQMAKRHQKDDLYTVSQVANVIGISTKTLKRWDEKGILVPRRIKTIRYYTIEQVKTIPTILEHNNSPRTTELRQRFA